MLVQKSVRQFIKKILIGRIIYLFAVFILLISGIACKKINRPPKEPVSIKGSDTMVNLVQQWAEAFMGIDSAVSIQITGGGSGTGIAALISGSVDVATSSREMKSSEIKEAKEKGVEYSEIPVALDGIAVIVHPGNPLDSLTLEELSKIFTGRITNFKRLGGPDHEITLYGRENSSGTYEFFKNFVLGKDKFGKRRDFDRSTQVLQGTSSLAEAVSKDINSIAYGGVGYFAGRTDIKVLKIKLNDTINGVRPVIGKAINYESIWDKSYPISRELFFFNSSRSKPAAKRFIDFVLSDKGQEIVKSMEYIPLPPKEFIKANRKLGKSK